MTDLTFIHVNRARLCVCWMDWTGRCRCSTYKVEQQESSVTIHVIQRSLARWQLSSHTVTAFTSACTCTHRSLLTCLLTSSTQQKNLVQSLLCWHEGHPKVTRRVKYLTPPAAVHCPKTSVQCAKAAAKALQVLAVIKRNFVPTDEDNPPLQF